MLRKTGLVTGIVVCQLWALQLAYAQQETAAAETEATAADDATKPAASATPSGETTAPAGAPTVRLRALEQRVNELKERVFRSKARLNLLKETVLHGVIAGSRVIIKHHNDMGGSYRLQKAVYILDGREIFAKSADDEDNALSDKDEFEVYSGSIEPGDHALSVHLIYGGAGYGVFSYLKGYEFNIRSSHVFTAAEGRQIVLTVRAYEKGNFTTALEDRPAIKYETEIYKVGQHDSGSAEGKPSAENQSGQDQSAEAATTEAGK